MRVPDTSFLRWGPRPTAGPVDNPMSPELLFGKLLYFDTRLSADVSQRSSAPKNAPRKRANPITPTAYLVESIAVPDAYAVKNFPDKLMPSSTPARSTWIPKSS